jgi:hypothetical protein
MLISSAITKIQTFAHNYAPAPFHFDMAFVETNAELQFAQLKLAKEGKLFCPPENVLTLHHIIVVHTYRIRWAPENFPRLGKPTD